MKAIYTLLVIALGGCRGSETTDPGPLTARTLVRTYEIERLWSQCPISLPEGALCNVPGEIPFTSGKLTLRSDSTYTLTISPWPSSATYGFFAPWWDPIGSGKWSYYGNDNLSLDPPVINGAVFWYGRIENGELVFPNISWSVPGMVARP